MVNVNANFQYTANFGPVIGQMQKLTAEANLLNNTLQNLDKQSVGLKTSLAASFASDLGKIGGYNAKMIELTDSVDQFGQSLLKQKLTLKQYAKEAIGAFTSSSNAHKLAVREVAREMSQLVTLGKGMDGKQMGMMITPATINLKDFNTQLAVSQKQWSIFNSIVQDGTTHLINFGKNTQWAGRQITVGLTVPLTIYGNTVSKIFREVDAELTRFQKVYGSDLMNTSSESTKSMVNDVRNLAVEFSRSFGIAAKETASLAADLAATGLEGQKLLSSLRETTRLAVLGDVSNQDAMKTTLSLQNAFKISTDDLADSVNFLNAVENQTSLSLQDLTTAIPKAGPVVKSLGGDVKDLSLLMVALKEGGISAAEGANALKSGMASLINPTKQASITAKQYGIDINAIVQANRGQLMPTIIAFQEQLQLLDDFGKAQVIENVFGKYQFARISALFDNLNASASQTNAVLGLMGQSSKELAATAYQEMDTLMNSSSKRFQRAIEGIKAQFITIGGSITSAITPILENVMGKIQKAIEFFENLPKPVKSFIKVATGLTAIAGPIIMMVGIFSNFLGYIGKGAMGMVNLGRRMSGIPTQKFEMLTDTQIMATKATEQLAKSFDVERSSVERLNQALGLYRQNLVEAINLNPAFLNRQMAMPKPTISGLDVPTAKLQRGGSAWVPGSGDGDKVPAMLEPGEYVVNKKAAAKYSSTLDQMNFQSAPRFQNGGRMPGYADESFIGPKPQISYNVQGTYRPGGYTPFANYPFASKESAESFQSTDPRKWGGSGSRITRDINDPQQKAYADWIAGHNSNQFRTGTGVMKRLDMEGHRDQMLRSMGPISQSIPLYRGTVLKEKGSNEFSGVGARELLMYIKYGMFEKAMGKKIQWSDMQSFSSNPNIASYNKFIESWTNPSNTNSKKAADRQLASMEMLPIIFRLASAKGQNGFNLSERALVQEVGMGDVVNEKEWVLNKPSGTITGIRQDMGTKNYIVDLMQNGGRIESAAGGYQFAHIVPPDSLGNQISKTYPIGLDVPGYLNSQLNSSFADKKELISNFSQPIAISEMSKSFNSFNKKFPESALNLKLPKQIQSAAVNTLSDAPSQINDEELYKQTEQEKIITDTLNTFKKSQYLRDVRANISEDVLIKNGFTMDKNGCYISPDGSLKLMKERVGSRTKWKDVSTKRTLASNATTDRRRTFPSNNPLLSMLTQSKQMGGRINGYATETTTWAKKAAAPKAYAGVLQGIPNWATKPNEYEAIVSALRSAGIPESDRLASFYIQDVLAHINPSTTNENGIYEKVWSAANLMKDSQVYNVFLETLRTRKDIGGLLNPSTVSRVAAASGLPMPVVQAELTKIADGVHPNTANGARVMMTLARMFPSRTSPGMPIAVAAGMGARLQGNFYDTLGQRALPSSLPNTTVRAYDPKGTGAPTSTGQGSRVRSTGLIMPSGAIRPSIVMPNIQSIPSAAGGTGTSATVKVDGMGNVLSNGIDDMVATTITGQPIAVSSKELLAIGPGGGIAGVTSPGDEARGNIVHPIGTTLMRGGKFQRLRGYANTSVISGTDMEAVQPAEQVTEPVVQTQAAYGRMDRFASSIGFLTSGVYTLQTAFQQFTATTQDGADRFTKMAAAATLAMTSIQGVSQMLVDNGKVQAMQDKATMMQAPGSSKMSSGMGKILGVGSKALGMLGGPMGMLATSAAIAAVNKGIAMYQAAVQKAKAAGSAMFKDPIEGAKLLGITLKDTSAIAQTYAKIATGLGMKGTGKGAYDKTYADVVKKDYGDLIDSLKVVLNQEEKRNKLLLTYINLTQKGFSKEDAKAYVQEIARQSGAMSAFNSINVDSLKTTTQIADQTVASTKALMSSIGTVDSELIGKYINKKTGTIYDTREQMMQAYKQQSLMQQIASTASGGFGVQIDENTPEALSAGVLGSFSSLNLDERQMGEAIAGALKTAYSIAATDPAAANQAGAMIIENLARGTKEQQDAANASIIEMMKEAGASSADLGYNFVLSGGLTNMATDPKFAGLGDQYANAISVAIQSGNIDIVNDLIANSGSDPSPEAMQAFVNKLAKIQALAKIDLEVDIQFEQTKKQLELIKTELGKTFDILIASKQAEVEIENKRHEQAMKNLENEAKRLNDKKDILQRNTDYYIKELEREKQAEDYYANQRKTGLSGLKAISGGDVFGFIGAQMDSASSADQFGRDRSMQAIQETADAAQKKLDEDLRAIDNRREAEAARHEAELANIEAEIEFLNKKRAISVGAAEKAMSKIEKVVAMSPSDPGYAAAVREAMSLATSAGMQASQVLQNADTSSMTKEELTNFNKVKEDLGLAIETFNSDKETALGVIGQDIEAITKNIADSLGAAGDILGQVITDINQPVKPGSAIATVAALAGIDVGTPMGGVTGEVDPANAPPSGGASGSSGGGSASTLPAIPGVNGAPLAPKNGDAGDWYQDSSGLWWQLGRKDTWKSVMGVPESNIPVGANDNDPKHPWGSWKQMASGGMLSGPGTGTSDSIPIMASNGEYVINASAVKAYGPKFMDKINAKKFASGGFIGSMPSMSIAPGMAAGGSVAMPSISAPPTPTYNIPSAGGGMSPSPIAQMARGGQITSNSSSVSSSPVMNFNGAGMDMVMHHVNKAVGGRISSNSRRIG